LRALSALAAVLGIAAVAAPATWAAPPQAGARYAGVATHGKGFLEFGVADGRRSLLPNPRLDTAVDSSLRYTARCGRKRIAGDWGLAGDGVRARAGSGRMRITRTGKFALADSLRVKGALRRLRLTGTFGSGGRTAAGSFEVRVAGAHGCRTGRVPFKARLTGQRHLVRGGCEEPGTRTLAETPAGRVYEDRFVGDDGSKLTAAYGCLNALRKRFFLALTSDPSSAGGYTFAGNFVGFATADCPSECIASGVDVVDLDTGVAKYNADAVQQSDGFGAPVESLVLAPSGAVAWVVPGEVNKLEGDARKATPLDSGPEIDAASLTLTPPDVLTWKHGAETRAATLR
jgi:hypothetical protein